MTPLWMLSALTSAALQASEPSVRTYHELPIIRYAQPRVPPPKNIKPDSIGMDITAHSAIVLDPASGMILFEKQASEQRSLASLTKLMTALVALDTLQGANPAWVVHSEDVNREGKDPLEVGATYAARDVLEAMLIGSVNTAGNMVAHELGGREAFVAKMNARAESMGLVHTHFVDSTGLSPDNVSSAYDVAKLLNAALSVPVIHEWTIQSTYSITSLDTKKTTSVESTNLLLGSFLNKGNFEVIGAKTGSLPEAGFCLAQRTRLKDRPGEVIVVAMGSESHLARFQDVKALTSWAFRTHVWPDLVGTRRDVSRVARQR